jgi:hypothetical protein
MNEGSTPEPNISFQQQTSESVEHLWDQIGFHKPLAGFWYNLTFAIISQMLSIFLAGIVIKIFYPYPESNGYRDVTGGIFTLLFTIMDLGTHMTMDRFIAEARIKDPGKMLHYIQFFIWYQAFTGLFQVTAVSLYAIYIVPNTNLSYGVWLMLIVATYQYPGYLGVFGGVLGSLQQYHRTALLGFITGQGFQRLTELGFVFLGRMYGLAHPEIGEIMGIAIGANIGVYVDDFFAMWLSGWFFSKAMKNEGIKVRDCFRVQFDKKLVNEALLFGVKTGAPALIGTITGLSILMIYINFVPQYTTFATLAGLMGGISGFVNWGGVSAPTPLIAESYLNGKKKLTQYYISQTWRYILLFQFLFLPSIVAIYSVLGEFFVEFEMDNYMLALPFFLPTLIRNLQQPLTSFADSIQLGTNHPTMLMILRFTEELMKIFFVSLWVIWLALPERFGITALLWILPCGELPAILFKTITAYVIIHKRIVPLRINKYQTFTVPIVSGLIVFGVLMLLLKFLYPIMDQAMGFLPSIIICIIALMFIILFGYIPLTGLLGGWDTESLAEFKRAAQMSGPSKWFVIPVYNLTEKACHKSRLFNKFPIDATEATKEAYELIEIKKIHERDYVKKN